ncbi:hypothetical protein CROQUDRAFT_651003 [Cronartium quercuum f. sp. fusiforme G11]|uniref:Uncharacterized protein n=1 Tax=Cronartium quercuum f. sp. fusiforme G11 TaxID=708437 RepID=A0A9P6NQM5_9BASI|nr:hypothetical protein CROQUDRAFT_651003 [Cronartium quercuum f. sp. fusiforme G11]
MTPEPKKPKLTGFVTVNMAYLLNGEIVEMLLVGSSFEYDLSVVGWMQDLTTRVWTHFKEKHPTFPSPQQIDEQPGLHSLPPYHDKWCYLSELHG